MAQIYQQGGGEKTPAVSVVMAVRDGARFLGPTLRSLAGQRGVDYEVVVVDDGSTDETPRLLAQLGPRVFRVHTLPPSGLVTALNHGLSVARAPWIARMDADDIAHPDRLRLQFAHGDLDVVGSRIACFPTQRIQRGLRRYEAWQNSLLTHDAMALNRFVESPLVHPSVMFRAESVRAVGGYRDCGWPEDYDLWLRLFAAGARFGKAPAVLTRWRDHETRVTRTAAYCRADAVARCKAHHLARVLDRPFWMLGTGADAKRVARALLAEGAHLAGWFDVNPRKLGQVIHGAPVREFAREHLGEAVVLVGLGGAGQRQTARTMLTSAGLSEGTDFWCVC